MLLLLLLRLFLLSMFVVDSESVECRKCTLSPLVPPIFGCNRTCTGDFCYRAERNISSHIRIESVETAVIMDCFDFPLQQLHLGCRRNVKGSVLCVCNSTDFCNEAESSNVVALPFVDCLKGISVEGISDNSTMEMCRANYCITNYVPMFSPNSAGTATWYACQDDYFLNAPLLAQFDVFIQAYAFYMPAGMCVKLQFTDVYLEELCTCPYMRNCSTSTKYPRSSGLRLDERKDGFISCALYDKEGVKVCTGHVCFIKTNVFNPAYTDFGCLTYGEGYDQRRLRLGTHQLNDFNYFLCAEKMCNMRSDADKLFEGLPSPVHQAANESCNCLMPTAGVIASHPLNLPLILGISSGAAAVVAVAAALAAYRVIAGKWPVGCAKNGRTADVITVTSSIVDSKNK